MNRIPYTGARQRHIATRLVVLLCLLLLGAITAPARAGASPGVDAVLLMDSSGSMAKNDPQNLRVPAAKLFMSLLDASDHIGLISFSDNGYPVLHLTAPDPDNSSRILAAADKVSSKGVYTNLYAALDKGVDMLDKESNPGQEKVLVLMSDGKMDVGNSDEDEALTRALRDELLTRVRDKHIKVYTIAFTGSSDVALLQDIARQSGGLFELANKSADLHEVFSDIFETAKSPDMLPIEGGAFIVDASIEEVTIVASKERENIRILLQAPDGHKLGSADADDDRLKWFLSEHFDMITLRKPQPGNWKLLFSGGKSRAYVVTNMSLNHNPQQLRLTAGADTVLEAWLEQDGQRLDQEAVLTNTRFKLKIEAPDGAVANFALDDTGQYGDRTAADGTYSNTLSYTVPGAYRLDIIAEGETFKRQKSVHFDVTAAAVSPPAPGPQAQAESVPAPAPPPVAEPAPAPEVPVEPETTPETPVTPETKLGLGVVIGIFVAINLLLALFGLGIWWLLKKRKRGTPDPEQEDDEADARP